MGMLTLPVRCKYFLAYEPLLIFHRDRKSHEFMSTEVTGLDWSRGKLLPAFQTPEELTVYDIRGASTETKISVTTFVGLINRPQPRVYLFINDDDVFW